MVEADDVLISMTDALVYCMQQPGALAVAFVDIQTGKAIAGDGIQNLDIDAYSPVMTELLVGYYHLYGNGVMQFDKHHSAKDQESGFKSQAEGMEVAITTSARIHLLYSLSGRGEGLYLYLVLNRDKGNIPLGRRCLLEIDARLHL